MEKDCIDHFCCELFAYEFYGNMRNKWAVIKMIKENKLKINISIALVIAAELFKIM